MALFPKKKNPAPQPPEPPKAPDPPRTDQVIIRGDQVAGHDDDQPRRSLPPAGRPPLRPAGKPSHTPPQDDNARIPNVVSEGSAPEKSAEPKKEAPRPEAPPLRRPAPSSVPRPQAPGLASGKFDLERLLAEAVQAGASDLHLTRNQSPMLRLDGRLVELDYPPLDHQQCEALVRGMLTPEQRIRFDEEWELDLSVEFSGIGRFRVNVHRQRGTTEAAFRVVNDVIKPIRQLGIPHVVEELARRRSGLMVVTGPTGSGKTTTLAAIVDQINNERECMIITVEDPIEYIHKNRRAIVKQREVTTDTHGFAPALRHVLRQDPDVIVVGEMRDLETIQTALISAETGHMVYSTLHTPDAVQTIDRIIDVFPPHHQDQTRIQLANTLIGVLAQQLIPMPGNRGRVVASEVLIANHAVRKTIRTGKTEQLMTQVQTSYDQGMVSMDKSLKNLYLQGMISYDDAVSRCKYPENFEEI